MVVPRRMTQTRTHEPRVEPVPWRIHFLVALLPVQDLLFCAKHLFLAANHGGAGGCPVSISSREAVLYDWFVVRAVLGISPGRKVRRRSQT